jgi:DNA-binding response OmpR family regulator
MHRILIIEDDDFDSFVIGDFLERNNFEVTVTENGLMGVNFAKQEKPDLILCKTSIPVLDGYEVIEALRHDGSTAKIPLFFIASADDSECPVRAEELGAEDYLIKPIDLDELLIKINQQLQ